MKFLKLIDEMLEAKDRRELDSKKRTSHHPSGYSDCMRKMFFDWTNFPVSNYRTATDIYKILAGKWIHQGFAELLKELYGDRVQTEVEFTYEHPDLQYPIHGFMDNVIVIDGVLIGIELKTSFGRGIVSIAKTGRPKDEHLNQTKIYLALNEVISSFSLPYLGRDSFYRTEFEVFLNERDRKAFTKIVVERFKKLENYVNNLEVPDREFHAIVKDGEIKDKIQKDGIMYKSDWQCLYCVYRDSCYTKERDSMSICIPEKLKGGLSDEHCEIAS